MRKRHGNLKCVRCGADYVYNRYQEGIFRLKGDEGESWVCEKCMKLDMDDDVCPFCKYPLFLDIGSSPGFMEPGWHCSRCGNLVVW